MNNPNKSRVGAKLTARLNLGDYNWIEFSEWIEDDVREDLDEGKTSRALDRLYGLLDKKLEDWATEHKDG